MSDRVTLPATLRPSQFDIEHFQEVVKAGNWFDADLYRLILKADSEHLHRLRLAFPAHVAVVEAWKLGGV